jgi:PAS domain-containing protein
MQPEVLERLGEPFYTTKETGHNGLEEEKNAMHKLGDKEQIFDSLFDHNPNAIGVFDHFGNLIRVNGAAENMLGFTAEELSHLPFVTFVAQEQLLGTLQGLDQVRRGSSLYV